MLRFAWLSVPALAAAARLLRWWGKVGMSSGSQAAGQKGEGGVRGGPELPSPTP